MYKIQIFNNSEFGQIRTITEDGKILFCGKDVAAALGYVKPQNAIAAHCRYALKRGIGVQTNFRADGTPVIQQKELLFIPEGDIYRLAAKSELPGADKFESWIFDEVLPSIRRTGGYALPKDYPSALRALADAEEKRLALEATNETMKPKALFADAVAASKSTLSIGGLAKIRKQNGVDTGQKRLFAWMRNNGYLMRRQGSDYNTPTQKAMNAGLFEIKESVVLHADGHTTISKTSKVTGKGQQYFMNLFLGDAGEKQLRFQQIV